MRASHECRMGSWGTKRGEGVNWLKEMSLTVFAAPPPLAFPQTRAHRSREQASRRGDIPLHFSTFQSLDSSLFTVIFSTRNLVWLGGRPEEGGSGGPTGDWSGRGGRLKKEKQLELISWGLAKEEAQPWEICLSPLMHPSQLPFSLCDSGLDDRDSSQQQALQLPQQTGRQTPTGREGVLSSCEEPVAEI